MWHGNLKKPQKNYNYKNLPTHFVIEVSEHVHEQELNENGRNVLDAVREGNLTLVRKFLEKGANLWIKDETGLTALHWAVIGDHVDITSVLLNHSADPNVQTAMHNTPLHRAARIGNVPACR